MNVIAVEFVNAMKEKLNSLGDNDYITRDKLCEALGVDGRYVNVVSLVLQEPEFSGFEVKKAKGICRKKSV